MERDGACFFKIRVKKYDSFPFRPDGVLAKDLPENIEGMQNSLLSNLKSLQLPSISELDITPRCS